MQKTPKEFKKLVGDADTRYVLIEGRAMDEWTQRTHDVNITSPQRRRNVMTLHWRWSDVIFTSCACRGHANTMSLLFYSEKVGVKNRLTSAAILLCTLRSNLSLCPTAWPAIVVQSTPRRKGREEKTGIDERTIHHDCASNKTRNPMTEGRPTIHAQESIPWPSVRQAETVVFVFVTLKRIYVLWM